MALIIPFSPFYESKWINLYYNKGFHSLVTNQEGVDHGRGISCVADPSCPTHCLHHVRCSHPTHGCRRVRLVVAEDACSVRTFCRLPNWLQLNPRKFHFRRPIQFQFKNVNKRSSNFFVILDPAFFDISKLKLSCLPYLGRGGTELGGCSKTGRFLVLQKQLFALATPPHTDAHLSPISLCLRLRPTTVTNHGHRLLLRLL